MSGARTRIVTIVLVSLSSLAVLGAILFYRQITSYVGPSGPRTQAYRVVSRTIAAIETGQKNAFSGETEVDGGAEPKYVHLFCPSIPAGAPVDSPGWRCLKVTPESAARCRFTVDTNGKAGADARWSAHGSCEVSDGAGPVEMWMEGRGLSDGSVERVSMRVVGD